MNVLRSIVRGAARVVWLVVRIVAAAIVAGTLAAISVARRDYRRRHPRRRMPRSVSSLERRVAQGPRIR